MMAGNRREDNHGTHEDSDDNHHHLDRWIIGIGGTAFTATVDYLFLWPESHLAALLVFAGWLMLIAIFVIAITRLGREWYVVALAGLLGAACLANAILGPDLPPETDIHGWLQAANDPMPDTGCDQIPKNQMILALGDTGMMFPQNGSVAFAIGACRDAVAMRQSADGIAVNAELLAGDGKTLVAQIENNEWNVVPGQISYIRRPDRSTLIVFDRYGREILWVRFLNPKAVRVRGIFSCRCEYPFRIDDKGIIAIGLPPDAFVHGLAHSCIQSIPHMTFETTDNQNGAARGACAHPIGND